MRKSAAMNSLLAGLMALGLAAAQEGSPAGDSSPKSAPKAEAPAGHEPGNDPKRGPERAAYDALYSEIVRALPQEGKSKVDSARGGERKPESRPGKQAPDPEELKRDALEKRKRELEDLPPDVKARVDKALSDLESRRREKRTEFKELKE